MQISVTAFLFSSIADNGLTLRGIISDLPTDPASLFAIALGLVFTAMVVWAGRSGGPGGGTV